MVYRISFYEQLLGITPVGRSTCKRLDNHVKAEVATGKIEVVIAFHVNRDTHK